MSSNDRVQNPLPAWLKDIAPAPVALLHSYRALGMVDGELIYVLQILGDYVQGQVPNQRKIAGRMRSSKRTLRKYNQHLAELGLATIAPRFVDGAQVENAYDFAPLFEACHVTYQSEQMQEMARLGAIDELLNKITEAHERGDDLQPLLDELFQLRNTPRILRSSPPRIAGSPSPPDPTILPPHGSQDPPPPGSHDPWGSRGSTPGSYDPPLTTTTRNNGSIPPVKDLPVVVSTLLNGNERLQAVYDWAVKAGVAGFSPKMIEILQMNPDPEVVRAHALDRLAAESIGDRDYKPGLFIHKVLTGEPAPPARCEKCLQLETGCTCDLDPDSEAARRRKYGEYWDIIQH